jgi:hypothetical protein
VSKTPPRRVTMQPSLPQGRAHRSRVPRLRRRLRRPIAIRPDRTPSPLAPLDPTSSLSLEGSRRCSRAAAESQAVDGSGHQIFMNRSYPGPTCAGGPAELGEVRSQSGQPSAADRCRHQRCWPWRTYGG